MIRESPFEMMFLLLVTIIKSTNKRSYKNAFSELVAIGYNSKEILKDLKGKKILLSEGSKRDEGCKLDKIDSKIYSKNAKIHDKRTPKNSMQQGFSNIPAVVQFYNLEDSDEEAKPIKKKNQNAISKQEISNINMPEVEPLLRTAETTKSQMSIILDKEKTELELLIESVISKPKETSSFFGANEKEPKYNQISNPVLSNKKTTSTNIFNQFFSLDAKLPLISNDDIKGVLETINTEISIGLNDKQCCDSLDRDSLQVNIVGADLIPNCINNIPLNKGIKSQTKNTITNNKLKVNSNFGVYQNSLSGTKESNYFNFSGRKNVSKNKQAVSKKNLSIDPSKEKCCELGKLDNSIAHSPSYRKHEIPIFLKDYEDEIEDTCYWQNTRTENKEKSSESILFLNKHQEKAGLPPHVFCGAKELIENKNLNPEENCNNEYFLDKVKNGNISIQSKDNLLNINTNETEDKCIGNEADLGLPTKKDKCIAVLKPKYVNINWSIERDITNCDENYRELFKILFEKNKGGCIEVYSTSKNVYLLNLYESIEISEIVQEIEINYIIRFYHVVSVFCQFKQTIKFLEYYNVASRPEIKIEVDNFLKNFINDNVLEEDCWLEIKTINAEEGLNLLKKQEQINIKMLITPFNKFLDNFYLKYEKLIGGFTEKLSILRLRRYENFTYNDIAKVFAYDFEHFFKNKKYSIILFLFPEVKYLINYLKNEHINFSKVKQVISVVSFVIFKFMFLRKNVYLDLKCQFHLQERNYLLSKMCPKFILNTRALLYLVYCKIMQKEKCVNMKKNILCHLFFNFLRVKTPEILYTLEFDEHIFLENYEFGMILENIFLFDVNVKVDGEKMKVYFISSLVGSFLVDFVKNTYKFLHKIINNLSDYDSNLDLGNNEIKHKLQQYYKRIKEDFYLKFFNALST